MEDNPYSAMLGTLRRDGKERSVEPWCLGRVEAVSPLAVRFGDAILDGGDLLVNAALLSGYGGQLDLSGITGTLNGDGISGGTLSAVCAQGVRLAAGDRVAMLRSADSQSFLVLCKVVG